MKKINLSIEALKEAANCLRILSHPVRLQIVQLLIEKQRSVGELADLCAIAHNVASTHLKILERCGFLASSRKGKSIYYKVIEKHLVDLLKCIEKKFS